MLPNIDREVLDDEGVIVRPSGSIGEPEINQPYSGVRLLGVLGDVGGRSEARLELRILNVAFEGPWAQAIQTGPPIAVVVTRLAITPGGRPLVLTLRLVSISLVVVVGPVPTTHHRTLRGGRRVEARCSRGLATRLGWKSLLLVD
jgi:hypothetical protein